jgi:peptide deformylase
MLGTAAQMQDIGIEQAGSPVLAMKCRQLALPDEATAAQMLAQHLDEMLQKIMYLHTFKNGRGIAAPQLGYNVALALVYGPNGNRITLVNPEIATMVPDNSTDDQYEGCLSFFNSRGLVRRPRHITVYDMLLAGKKRMRTFQNAEARLICHEVDHLNGMLYTSRMKPDDPLVPAACVPQNSHSWVYS